MPKVNNQEEHTCILDSVKSFSWWFNYHGPGSIFRKMSIEKGPAEIREIFTLTEQFTSKTIKVKILKVNPESYEWEYEDRFVPLIKRAIIDSRKSKIERVEESLGKTNHPEVINELYEALQPYNSIMEKDWFIAATPIQIPPLSKFLKLSEIDGYRTSSLSEEVEDEQEGINKRDLDEKFGILQSPSLFLSDLKDYRRTYEIRDSSVIACYLDIDNFKSYNEKYGGETEVDQKMLPIFMRVLEAHVFSHGWAYRVGGDEYEILLPNLSLKMAVQFLKEFQEKLINIEYIGIQDNPTVSIGFVYVDADCFLSEREIERKACEAKNYAKKQGRDRIGSYRGILFREKDLYIVD